MKDESGFTMVELLIVVAIIGILAALALSNFNLFKSNAKNAAAANDARGLAPGVDLVSTGGVDGSATPPTIAPNPFGPDGGSVPASPPIPGARYSPGTYVEITFPAPAQYCIKTYQLGGSVCYEVRNGAMTSEPYPCTPCA